MTSITFERWALKYGTETVTFNVPDADLPEGFNEWSDEEQTDWLFDNLPLDGYAQEWEWEETETQHAGAWEGL